MRIRQARRFDKTAKRLHRNQKDDLNAAVKAIQENPAVGELKAGDLAGLRMYKFHMANQLALLIYRYDDRTWGQQRGCSKSHAKGRSVGKHLFSVILSRLGLSTHMGLASPANPVTKNHHGLMIGLAPHGNAAGDWFS